MKKLIFIVSVLIAAIGIAQEPSKPASETAKIAVVLENIGFSADDLHVWITQDGKKFERYFSLYRFRIIEPLAYANREIDVYLPHRIVERERAVEDREKIAISVSEEEIVRLLKGSQKNAALVRSYPVENAVLAVAYEKLKKQANQRPERNAGAASPSTSESTPGVAHP